MTAVSAALLALLVLTAVYALLDTWEHSED